MEPDLRLALASRHQDLYWSSPYFKNAITVLAQLLEPMVDGLASSAEANDAKIRALMDAVNKGL